MLQNLNLTDRLTAHGMNFPAARRWDGDPDLSTACGEISTQRDALAETLSVHGAILFRDFPLRSAEDFDAFICAFDFPNFRYQDSLSNAVRVNKTERVFTANEAPPEVTIFLHHEMAQTPVFPGKLFFFCEQAAETGGATPLCRSDVLLDRLTERCPEFVKRCREHGLKYSNTMPAADDPESGMGRSWQSTFSVETKSAAESRLQQLGYSWQWLDDGSLRATTPCLSAVKELPCGRSVFFNQLIAAFNGWKDVRNDPLKSMTHGDGSPLDRDAVETASELAESLSYDVPWQNGDVALVDNYLVMHGRRTFSGVRRVLASLVAS